MRQKCRNRLSQARHSFGRLLESTTTDFKDDRIAGPCDGSRTRQSCEKTNLADQLALCDLGNQVNRLPFVNREATGQHDEEAVRWLRFANQHLSASQDATVGFGS